MTPTLVIINPASAGGRTAARWPEIHRQLLLAGVEHDSYLTIAPGDAITVCRAALRSGTERVVAVGGDGTLNEVCNGFFDEESGAPIAPHAVLGFLPSGTGGDFRRTLEIPTDMAGACTVVAAGATRRVDVGRIEYGDGSVRHFVNVADCGMGGEVAHRVNTGRRLPNGTATFLWHLVATWLRFRNRQVRVEVDGQVRETKVQTVAVANGRYYGGGLRIAPTARLDSGKLDVVVVGDMSRPRAVALLPALYRGRHLGRRGVELLRGSHVRITPLDGVPLRFEVEGEEVGVAPATIRCLPAALRVCAPA